MRKVPRSFFWIDQQLIRSGLWLRMSTETKLVYVALAASVDREGISLWGPKKIMELMGISAIEVLEGSLVELESMQLIARNSDAAPVLRLLNLSTETDATRSGISESNAALAKLKSQSSVVIHTTTTVTLGEPHVESRSSI